MLKTSVLLIIIAAAILVSTLLLLYKEDKINCDEVRTKVQSVKSDIENAKTDR